MLSFSRFLQDCRHFQEKTYGQLATTLTLVLCLMAEGTMWVFCEEFTMETEILVNLETMV